MSLFFEVHNFPKILGADSLGCPQMIRKDRKHCVLFKGASLISSEAKNSKITFESNLVNFAKRASLGRIESV
jgi:hypothetical protein